MKKIQLLKNKHKILTRLQIQLGYVLEKSLKIFVSNIHCMQKTISNFFNFSTSYEMYLSCYEYVKFLSIFLLHEYLIQSVWNGPRVPFVSLLKY